MGIGIKSELGRGDGLAYNTPGMPGAAEISTSVFDPVLCECVYRWFSAEGWQVLDPFAGGSVRGIIAGMLGRRYWGSDLRAEQIEANVAQASEIAPVAMPRWVCGDSTDTVADAPDADLIFSCPPYGDLEVYSDDPKDLSAMRPDAFDAGYREIIRRSVGRLKRDRFACFVVGNYRDGRGLYRDLVGLTVSAFEAAGAGYYNEAVLVNAVGTGAMRVSGQFSASRKLVKVHQNVLVFVVGDPKKASAAMGAVQCSS